MDEIQNFVKTKVQLSNDKKGKLTKRFSAVVNTHKLRSNKIYKTELTKIKIYNQVKCKYLVDP